MKNVKRLLLTTALTSTFFTTAAQAGCNHENHDGFSGNLSFSSEYLKRGIAMSDHDPSIGLDIQYRKGEVLVGTSTNLIDLDTGADFETEIFGQYTFMLNGGVDVDLGVSHFLFTGMTNSSEINYTEVYGAVKWNDFTVTNRWANDYLGTDATHTVLEVAYDYALPVGNLNVGLGWNHSLDDNDFNYNGDSSYTNWHVGYTYTTEKNVVLGLAYDGTDIDEMTGQDFAEDRLSASITFNF